MSELEQRSEAIKVQLANLANYSLSGGIGAIGYRSQPNKSPDHREWVELTLADEFPLDEIVLVPAIRRDAANGFQADGFPESFRVIVGTKGDLTGKVIAEYGPEAGVLPRIAPLKIPCARIPGSWIRIETLTLSRRAFDGQFAFQLAEVLAFNGSENVALHRPVTTGSSSPTYGWANEYLVDGVLPYLMDAATGAPSVAFLTTSDMATNATLTLDLGTNFSIARIHLHAVDQADTVPQAFAGDIGIPKLLRVEGANQPDFSDATVLANLHHQTIYDVGPIMIFTFAATPCRYVRFCAVEPFATALYGKLPNRLGFAEIEIFASGRNVALHAPVTASFKSSESETPRRLANLTDGLNIFGAVLPLRDWLAQLALRHELEKERPLVVAELDKRYARQKAMLRRMTYLTSLLALGAVVIVLVDRLLRQRAIERTRKRIAADLHDELGADLHAIGLLSDLASNRQSAPEKLGGILERMRALTERAAQAARYCTNMLEARGLYGDLATDLRRTTVRLLADLEHDLKFEGEESLQQLRPRKRIDLLLFYQECLTNIIRHSGATRVQIALSATSKEIRLNISDNGSGLNGQVPASLKRRARLLGAQIEAGTSELKGANIRLRLKLRRFGLFK